MDHSPPTTPCQRQILAALSETKTGLTIDCRLAVVIHATASETHTAIDALHTTRPISNGPWYDRPSAMTRSRYRLTELAGMAAA